MASIYISDLINRTSITNDDFIPLVQSSSLTTYRTDFASIGNWMSGSATASWAKYAISASYATSASYAISASHARTASYLLYSGFPNGTASYALSASRAETASYFDVSNAAVKYATYAVSASWASSSISASYITASNIDGIIPTASYSVTASYAINASYGYSSSYATTASYAWTGSHAFYAESAIANQGSFYGPFTSSAVSTSPTKGWSQYDYAKRAIAFNLANTSDVIIECTVNYATYELNDNKAHYIAAIVKAGTDPDPTIDVPVSVATFDDFKFIGFTVGTPDTYNVSDLTTKFYIKKAGLTAGKWVVYFAFYNADYGTYPISPFGATGVGQLTALNDFLNSPPVQDAETGAGSRSRFYKFANSAQVNVYSTVAVTQDIP